jgi:hypothetical protein
MNEMAYVFQAWLPLVVWQQVDAPEYRKGFITVTVLSVILIVSTFGAQFLHTGEKLWKGYVSWKCIMPFRFVSIANRGGV